MSAKYDFSKVSREALEKLASSVNQYNTEMNTGGGSAAGVYETDLKEVLRQARVRTPEEVALELAEYCSKELCAELLTDDANIIFPLEGRKIRRLADEYRKLANK